MQLGFRRGTLPRRELRAIRATLLPALGREPGRRSLRWANDGTTGAVKTRLSRPSMRVSENQDQAFDDRRPHEDVKPQGQQSSPVEPHTCPGVGGSPARSTLGPNCNVGHMCVSSRLRSVIADTLRLRNGESAPAPTIKCVSSTEVPLHEVPRSTFTPCRQPRLTRSAPVELHAKMACYGRCWRPRVMERGAARRILRAATRR